jgi:ribonuclease E
LTHEHDAQERPEAQATAQELASPPAIEPFLTEAVGDLDAAPRPDAPLPTAQPAAQQEPRRRSTVREAAPVASGNVEASPPPTPVATPAPQPVITEDGETGQTDKPRRSGWWSRRLAGG